MLNIFSQHFIAQRKRLTFEVYAKYRKNEEIDSIQ